MRAEQIISAERDVRENTFRMEKWRANKEIVWTTTSVSPQSFNLLGGKFTFLLSTTKETERYGVCSVLMDLLNSIRQALSLSLSLVTWKPLWCTLRKTRVLLCFALLAALLSVHKTLLCTESEENVRCAAECSVRLILGSDNWVTLSSVLALIQLK